MGQNSSKPTADSESVAVYPSLCNGALTTAASQLEQESKENSAENSRLTTGNTESLWFFRDRFNKFQKFGHEGEWGKVDIDSDYLTNEYKKNPNGIVKYQSGSYSYELNMGTMKQKNTTTGVEREIMKVGLEVQLYEGNLSSDIVIVDIQAENCGIPQIASNKLTIHQGHTVNKINIKRLREIRNPHLKQNYERAKLSLKVTNEGEIGEKIAFFHEATEDDVLGVARIGFETSLKVHRHGCVYGKGSYFAAAFSLANKFAKVNNGVKQIIVAKILTGKAAQGASAIEAPPYLDERYPDLGRYDSCVEDVNSTSMYAIHNKDQTLPYLIMDYSEV